MSLYHKHRPDSLKKIKGNKTTVQTLEKMLANEKTMPHAFLFHGPTGCGKTTFGRIIANTLGVSTNDLNEINSSDFRGIDTIREIIRNCQYKPVNSPYRVYILDEVHKMTNDAQNAILKILEDTPAHVIFILCTTEPQKLLGAIKNRCSQFTVELLNEIDMLRLLKTVCKKEKVKVPEEVLDIIVSKSNGHSRDALQILDQVICLPDLKDMKEVAKQIKVFESKTNELAKALIYGKDWGTICTLLKGLQNENAETIRRGVLGYCRVVLLSNPKNLDRLSLIIEEFMETTYDNGFNQIVYACSCIVNN